MRCRIAYLLLLLLPGSALAAQSAPDRAEPQKHLETAGEPLPAAPMPEQQNLPPAQGPRLALTLDEAVAMARRNSPRMREAAALTRRAEGSVLTAKAYANPSVEIYEGDQYSRPVANPGTPGLLQHYAVLQAVEIPTERRARLRAAQFGVASSRAGVQVVGLSVVADAQRAFYNALRQREAIRHAEENLQLVDDLRRRTEVEVRTGEKGRLELTRAEAELARARFQVRSAELQYANAIASLRAAIAAPADAEIDPQGEFEPRTTLPPLTELRARVLSTHPIVAASKAGTQAAEATLQRERALRIPQPVAFAEYENQPELRYWRVGATIPIPLWDRRRGQIADAKAAIAQSQAALDQRQLELVAALERAYEQYQLADQQATSLEAGSLRAAESAVEAAKAAYRFGERGIVEVLDAQRVLQSVRADLLDAQAARQSAMVDLESLGAMAPAVRP